MLHFNSSVNHFNPIEPSIVLFECLMDTQSQVPEIKAFLFHFNHLNRPLILMNYLIWMLHWQINSLLALTCCTKKRSQTNPWLVIYLVFLSLSLVFSSEIVASSQSVHHWCNCVQIPLKWSIWSFDLRLSKKLTKAHRKWEKIFAV